MEHTQFLKIISYSVTSQRAKNNKTSPVLLILNSIFTIYLQQWRSVLLRGNLYNLPVYRQRKHTGMLDKTHFDCVLLTSLHLGGFSS